jgi:hypothetical protein
MHLAVSLFRLSTARACLALCAVFLVVTLSACATLEQSVEPANKKQSNVEMHAIRVADQADRVGGANGIDWSLVATRDKERIARTKEIVAAGGLRTAEDFFDAALVYQHGSEIDDIRMAYSLASVSASIDPEATNAKWLTAAAWDRIMMRLNKPQWHGTQFKRSNTAGAQWALYDIDESAVTEDERKRLNVPSLAEQRERAKRMNAGGK